MFICSRIKKRREPRVYPHMSFEYYWVCLLERQSRNSCFDPSIRDEGDVRAARQEAVMHKCGVYPMLSVPAGRLLWQCTNTTSPLHSLKKIKSWFLESASSSSVTSLSLALAFFCSSKLNHQQRQNISTGSCRMVRIHQTHNYAA